MTTIVNLSYIVSEQRKIIRFGNVKPIQLMTNTYSLEWLTNKFDNNEPLKFLFFWGHSNTLNEQVGKHCLSQWFELPFSVDNTTYKTAEHWMMAKKALLFNDVTTHQKIIDAKRAGEAKELGRQIKGFDEQTWVANRYNIVVTGNIHKFNQHIDHAHFLMNTKDRVLVEASPVDKIWGIGLSKEAEQVDNPYFWNGLNLLGFALMEVRDFFIKNGHFEYKSSLIAPPWKVYPDIDPNDIFWRMGKGEDVIEKFTRYYEALEINDRLIFRLSNPIPYKWISFYNE